MAERHKRTKSEKLEEKINVLIEKIENAVKQGKIKETKIDEAISKIYKLKCQYGIA